MIRRVRTGWVAVAALMTLGACSAPDAPPDSGVPAQAPTTASGSPSNGAGDASPVPWPANVPSVDTLSVTGRHASIRRGHAILTATRDSLPEYVGNDLRCTSCHLDDGRRANALPWVGVMARFPQYRTRNARINRIEDRVNDCIERSLAGRTLPSDAPAMRDIVAYFTFLSHGVPAGRRIAGQGAPPLRLQEANAVRGDTVFVATCARCHGAAGEGTPLAPAVWGARSYSIGAGMGRVRTAAAFIAANMPYDRPGVDPQDAMDVAAYINSQERPAFARGAGDWPFGGAPVDVPYPTAGRSPQR